MKENKSNGLLTDESNEVDSFEKQVEFLFLQTGHISAALLLRELARRFENDSDPVIQKMAPIIDGMLNEASAVCQRVFDEARAKPGIIRLNQ